MKSLDSNQTGAKEHLEGWKVGALFMEAGTGKTRVALEIVNRSPCDFCLWVAPLRTLDNVKDEIQKWGGIRMPVHFVGIESIQGSDRIYLSVLDMVTSSSNPFVVVDESLKIKNAEAKRTKRLLEIGKIADYKLILNGTPLSRNLLDLWSQMEFISPLILNMTINQFKNTFCEYTRITKRLGYKQYTKEFITGYENIDFLYSLIRHYVYECDLHLNVTQNYKDVRYSLNDDCREMYNAIKAKFLSDEMLEWKNNNIFLEMTQKMQHAYCCTEDKFEKLNELFKNIDESHTIIFCKYIDSRQECEKRYPKAKVLSYQKESLGLNLQDYNNTVYFDKNWDYALHIQSSRRTFRKGQEYNCYYWNLTGDVGLESMIDKNISKKISMTEYFKQKTKEEIVEEL